jgi:hypothetical protein
MIPKMINPAKKAVKTLPVAIIKASLYCSRTIEERIFAWLYHPTGFCQFTPLRCPVKHDAV